MGTAVIVAAARTARFLILGFLAIKFGRVIISVGRSPAFIWSMVVVIALCFLVKLIVRPGREHVSGADALCRN